MGQGKGDDRSGVGRSDLEEVAVAESQPHPPSQMFPLLPSLPGKEAKAQLPVGLSWPACWALDRVRWPLQGAWGNWSQPPKVCLRDTVLS